MADKTYKMQVTLTDNSVIDAGTFVVPQGPQGPSLNRYFAFDLQNNMALMANIVIASKGRVLCSFVYGGKSFTALAEYDNLSNDKIIINGTSMDNGNTACKKCSIVYKPSEGYVTNFLMFTIDTTGISIDFSYYDHDAVTAFENVSSFIIRYWNNTEITI